MNTVTTVGGRVAEVTISTATVDIQVMRIGSKQMALAVFRQLQTRSIFGDFGGLVTSPWGWVNYDRSMDWKPFVFSYNGILYRGDVNLEFEKRLAVFSGRWDDKEGWYIALNNMRHGSIELLFDAEDEAHAYLANRQGAISVLESAPQLFIGV